MFHTNCTEFLALPRFTVNKNCKYFNKLTEKFDEIHKFYKIVKNLNVYRL